MEPKKELTKDQEKRIKKIYMDSAFRTMWAGCRSGILLGAANIVIATVATVLEINSDAFIFLSSATSVIFIFRSLGQKIRADHDRVREETKKILEE